LTVDKGILPNHFCFLYSHHNKVDGNLAFKEEFVPLTTVQVADLNTAIGDYAFPATYYDFATNIPVHAEDMAEVEAAIQAMLISENPDMAKQGLATLGEQNAKLSALCIFLAGIA
jgi:hypothetical protein